MVLPSDQVSRMISAQQQAYALQAAHAAQAGSFPRQFFQNPQMAGFAPASYGLQNEPLKVAGFGGVAQPSVMTAAVGGAIPGAVGMGTVAAGLLGYRNRLGWLDPFTGVSRAFGMGASSAAGIAGQAGQIAGGAHGMGLMSGMRAVGSTFAQGGIRAGLGALGGGLAGAAIGMLPYYAAGKGVEAVAGNVQEGARNIEDVRAMIQQNFAPQMGRPGARTGGGPSRQLVKNVSSFLHEMASEDVVTSMKDMKTLMDQAGQAGMLSGVFDERSFKERFRSIVRQARSVSEILGVTLKEGGQFLSQAQRMGLWTAQDVMGAAISAKAMGPGGATALMGSMQQGAQMAHALGGTMRTGAQFGRQLFEQTTAAQQAGVLSERDIMEYTGGVGGAEGRQMIAGSMQRLGATYSRSPMGTLMMAGLGEISGEGQAQEFTGRVDPELLRQFQTGAITVQELAARGRRRVGQNKNLATTFHMVKGGLSQEVVGQMGMEGMAAAMQAVIDKAGRGNAPEGIQRRFMQMQTPGMSDRDARLMQKLMRDLPRIQDERSRRQVAATEDSLRQLQERRYRSFEGLADAFSSVWEEGFERPIQEAVEGFVTRTGENVDKMVRSLTGRTKQLTRLDLAGRQRLMGGPGGVLENLQRGTVGTFGDLGITNVGEAFLSPGTLQQTIMTSQLGRTDRAQTMLGGGTLTGTEISNVSPVARLLARRGLTLQRMEEGEELRPGEVAVGGETFGAQFKANLGEAQRVQRQEAMRALSPTMGGLFGGETEEKRDAMERVKSGIREMHADIDVARRLRKAKEDDPDSYSTVLMEELKKRAGVGQALAVLGEGERDIQTDLNAVAVATNELDMKGGALTIDFERSAAQLNLPVGQPAEVEQWFEDKTEAISEATRMSGWEYKGFKGVAKLLGASEESAASFAEWAAEGGAPELSEADIESITTSGKYGAADIAAFALKNMDKERVAPQLRQLVERGEASKFSQAAAQGDAAARRLQTVFEEMDEDERQRIPAILAEMEQGRRVILGKKETERLQEAARARGPILELAGVRRGTTEQVEQVRQAFARGDTAAAFGEVSTLTESLVSGRGRGAERDIDRLLSGAGGIGGVHAARRAAIERTMADETVTTKEFEGLRQRLRRSGIDIGSMMSGEQQAELSEMLKSGKGLEGAEIKRVTDVLKEISDKAFGTGAGAGAGKEQQLRSAQVEYLQKNREFVDAVGRVLGDKLVSAAAEDVKGASDNVFRKAQPGE